MYVHFPFVIVVLSQRADRIRPFRVDTTTLLSHRLSTVGIKNHVPSEECVFVCRTSTGSLRRTNSDTLLDAL